MEAGGSSEQGRHQPYLPDRPSTACLHADGQQQGPEQHGSQQLLYRTASDGSPVVYQGTENSLASSASRLSPEACLGMQRGGLGEPQPSLSRSWSTSHLPYTLPAAQGPGFGSSPGSHAFLLPKIEEGLQPALLHMPVLPAQQQQAGQPLQQGQQPTGEVLHEFSRALGHNLLGREQQEQARAAAAGYHGRAEEAAYMDAESEEGPRAPSKRGPRGTSSKYRGVTRHRC